MKFFRDNELGSFKIWFGWGFPLILPGAAAIAYFHAMDSWFSCAQANSQKASLNDESRSFPSFSKETHPDAEYLYASI